MAQENRISAELTEKDLKIIFDNIDNIEALMPWLTNLTPKERITLPKAADKTVSFLDKSLDYCQRNPQFVPPFLNVKEFNKDVTLAEKLLSGARPIRMLADKMEDTAMRASSEAYQAALLFYQAVKAAAKMGVPGAQTIYEDLKARFPGRPSNRSNGASDEVEE